MNNESICVQGSVKLKQVKCNEKPFALDEKGRITYNGKVFLTRIDYGFFGREETSWDTLGQPLVKAFNDVYKEAYEKDRFEWV